MKIIKKLREKGVLTVLSLAVVTLASASNHMCAIWIFGSDEIPEELL